MKIMVNGPCGVLENVISIVGFEDLCFLIIDDPELVQDIFDAVGSRLLKYYERSLSYESAGILMGNDDWGFKTQTMLSVDDMRKYVFPWHKKIVDLAHRRNIPAVLHSCGQASEIWDDIIDDIGYDGKHSFA
ncbi:MAG: hypothetical protein HQL31_07785 [Planctomycetes bacterium]|nr:hypothetical protein [Planctomycetota bacterium]